MMKRMGFIKPDNVGPGSLNATKPTPEDVRSLLDLQFEHVLPVHGAAVIGDARNKYRPAIERAVSQRPYSGALDRVRGSQSRQ